MKRFGKKVLADVNGDTSVDSLDANEILNYVGNIIQKFSMYN